MISIKKEIKQYLASLVEENWPLRLSGQFDRTSTYVINEIGHWETVIGWGEPVITFSGDQFKLALNCHLGPYEFNGRILLLDKTRKAFLESEGGEIIFVKFRTEPEKGKGKITTLIFQRLDLAFSKERLTPKKKKPFFFKFPWGQ